MLRVVLVTLVALAALVHSADTDPPSQLYTTYSGTAEVNYFGADQNLTGTATFSEDRSTLSLVFSILSINAAVTWNSTAEHMDSVLSSTLINGDSLGIYNLSADGLSLLIATSMPTSDTPTRPTEYAPSASTLLLTLSAVVEPIVCEPDLDPLTGLIDLDELEVGQVRVMRPTDAGTGCMFGDDFAFVVRRGAYDRGVVIDWMGGGACWDYETCADNDYTAIPDEIFNANCSRNFELNGILSGPDENDYANWTYILVPYCTQDLHIGSGRVTYEDPDGIESPLDVRYNGYNNTLSVLEYLFANVPSPDEVLVTGCSAGAYASMSWTPYIIEEYARTSPSTRVTLVSDSALGILTTPVVEQHFGDWNYECQIPRWLNINDTELAELAHDPDVWFQVLERISSRYPNNRFAFYSALEDHSQRFFFGRMGFNDSDGTYSSDTAWDRRARQQIHRMIELDNVFVWAVRGETHCTMAMEEPWSTSLTTSAGGTVVFQDWLADLLNPDEEPSRDTICDTCSLDDIDGCDGEFGSGLLVDDCGVCNGTNECDFGQSAPVTPQSQCPKFPLSAAPSTDESDSSTSTTDELLTATSIIVAVPVLIALIAMAWFVHTRCKQGAYSRTSGAEVSMQPVHEGDLEGDEETGTR